MNITDYLEYLQEVNYFISEENKYYNFDKWGKEFNTLFIVGLSGSGKSTISKKLSKKYNCELFDMDLMNDVFCMKVKKEISNKDWENKKLRYKLIDDTIQEFFYHLKTKKELNIVEGVTILNYPYNRLFYKNKPVIIMNTSVILSSLRGLKRNFKEYQKDNTKYILIKDFIENQRGFIEDLKKFEKIMEK